MNNLIAFSEWSFTDEGIISGEKEISYFCVGGYCIDLKDGNTLDIDWNGLEANMLLDERLIRCEHSELDKDFINEVNSNIPYENITLDFFRNNFKNFNELAVCIDIDGEPCNDSNVVTCTYFELRDLDTNASFILIDDRKNVGAIA